MLTGDTLLASGGGYQERLALCLKQADNAIFYDFNNVEKYKAYFTRF